MNDHSTRIRELCRYIERHSDESLRLKDLAARAGLSRFHFQRVFKAIVGLTPRQYVDAQRVKHLKHALKSPAPITNAGFDAGFSSLSDVYQRADTRLGMTPTQYRAGGEGIVITYVGVDSAVGRMMIGATDRGLCFVQFGDGDEGLREALAREYPAAEIVPMATPHSEQFDLWIDALKTHLDGGNPHLDLPLDIRATAFQMKVWNYLQTIPFGKVQSYAEVASGIGQPSAARAVARACAQNTVAIVIPCHRVIRGTGELAGYRWGLERKRSLIDRERSINANR
ncbi:MAG TPA: methylated-DNA--[protein]-cysteine S-methyltransferase [Verrucomicrobiae bacterium]|jgi:AraC family transcriptional regulator of adaptative response/methylated-DNA-[protein]-cysteine methyltransferase|nr:methylated-DNA--[protein]-cysteine S-methyltransferase [Verrucomicrobiae bacterium]